MRIEGSIRANLIAAVSSARRLRGRPVHGDTIAYWRRLLDYAAPRRRPKRSANCWSTSNPSSLTRTRGALLSTWVG